MELTFIGLIQVIAGCAIIVAGSANSAFLLLIVSSLFDGSAAVLLPALGGSSIPPVQFALMFVFLRILVPKGGLYGRFPEAVRANAWLVLFCLYGIATAYIGPRLFRDAISIYPMRPAPNAGLFDVIPLAPTSQNLTAGTYLLGTLLLAIAAHIFCRGRGGAKALVDASIWGGWFFIITGLLDLLSRGTPVEEVLSIFRNGDYVQMNVEVDGFVRIRGLLPEASAYAGACFTFFVINAELWYRSIRAGATGLLSVVLVFMLVMSTSSTAYVALACYAAFFVLRALAAPGLAPRGKTLRVSVLAYAILCIVVVMLAVVPELPTAIYRVVLQMTVEKSTSDSGLQRLFWAMQGVDGIIRSYGLGIGAGSFRSSSMITAIAGSMGVIGVVAFILYLLAIFQPSRRSTWSIGDDLPQTLGGAFSAAAVLSLVPAAIGSPHASPPAIFSILAGAALALRPAAGRQAKRSILAGPEASLDEAHAVSAG